MNQWPLDIWYQYNITTTLSKLLSCYKLSMLYTLLSLLPKSAHQQTSTSTTRHHLQPQPQPQLRRQGEHRLEMHLCLEPIVCYFFLSFLFILTMIFFSRYSTKTDYYGDDYDEEGGGGLEGRGYKGLRCITSRALQVCFFFNVYIFIPIKFKEATYDTVTRTPTTQRDQQTATTTSTNIPTTTTMMRARYVKMHIEPGIFFPFLKLY